MKQIKVGLLLWFLCAVNCAVASAKIAPKTVVDYFLLLPQNAGYFEVQKAQRKDQFFRYGTIDIPHDYLKFPGDGHQPTLTVALFRYHGSVAVAVRAEGEGEGTLDFWRYRNGSWQRITKTILPAAFRYNARHQYVIPRRGTTIQVLSKRAYDQEAQPGQTRHLYDLAWKNGRFVKR